MAKVHEVGKHFYWQRLYWHSDNPPLFHKTTTQEIERPYRHGTSLVVRVPFTKIALVMGKWRSIKGEVDALLTAMQGRVTKGNSIQELELEDW